MKPLNWVALAILTVCSIMFTAFYFLLGFNETDWPEGMVLAAIWWIAIIVVGVAIQLQKRHFDKKDGIVSPKAAKRQASSRKGSVGAAVITAILVPTLAFGTFSATSLASADDVSSTTQATSNSEDSWFYKLSESSTTIDLFYSIDDASLVQLQPGDVLEASHETPVEFFVRPKVGYLVDASFKHSGNANQFVTPSSKGTFSSVGANELPGFASAVNEALELGCTKEFHYTYTAGHAWQPNTYREFAISTIPFAVNALYYLEGGTINGKATYADRTTYYGPIDGHSDQYLITLTTDIPQREGYVFAGWTVADDATLFSAGAQVNVQDYWRYLYDHSKAKGASLPIRAQWKEEVAEVPDDAAGDANDSIGSSDSSGNISSAGSDDAGSTTPDTDDSTSTTPGDSNQNGMTDSDGTNDGATGEGGSTSGGAGSTGDSTSGSSDSSDNVTSSSSNASTSGSAAGSNTVSGTTSDSASSSAKPIAGEGSATATMVPSASGSNPMTGDVAHGALLNANQVTSGTADADVPFADGINATAKVLREGLYSAEEAITDDPVALSFGISYANRGCWVCDYLKVGIVLTLLYGTGVLVYRSVRHNRKQNDTSSEDSSATTATASV